MNSTIVQTIYSPYSLSIPHKVLARVFGKHPKESKKLNDKKLINGNYAMGNAFIELEKHVFHKSPIGVLIARKVINHNGTGIYIGYAAVDELDSFNLKRGKEIANSRIDFLVKHNPDTIRENTPTKNSISILHKHLDAFVARAKKYFKFEEECGFLILPCFTDSERLTMCEISKVEFKNSAPVVTA